MTTTPMNPTQTSPDLAAREVAERIRAGRNFLITSHRNPDGDALGSGLALQGLLRKMGKSARVVVRDGFGKPLYNIPGAEEVTISDTLPPDYPSAYDAVFTMECPEVERSGYPVLPGPVVNIDHHLGNTMYGEINYLDVDAPSVGEMVMQLNRHHLRLPLDREVAIAMYVSLSTDTGFFRYHNTTLRAFEAAAELVRAGVVPGDVSLWINESVTPGSIKLLGLCLTTLALHEQGRIATTELPRRFFIEAEATPEDTEGIVNYGRNIEGVMISALLKEGENGTRVSLRAKPGYDVQQIAAMFGGGGHAAASGCTIPLPLGEAKAKLLGLLREIL
ncbi:MAG TPA: bifunctional oligoribonuclease/PAP phosphatase NrnA [Thermoanaerobaculia bacterium]|nr:bifunctional oligoribonuclease/PAP phosphatase NrnA [Thermoanaerobaculia bacterium]